MHHKERINRPKYLGNATFKNQRSQSSDKKVRKIW